MEMPAHHRVHNSHALVPNPSQTKAANTLLSYFFFKSTLILFPPLRLGLPSGLIPSFFFTLSTE
jgi:hypothetical protein